MSIHPELDKLQAVKVQSQAIGEFLDWLVEQGVSLCRWSKPQQAWIPDCQMINDRLAEYFGIDLQKVDQEQRAILEEFRVGVQQGSGIA